MKYYIILRGYIHFLGGGEIYTRNKLEAASKQGYTSIVIYAWKRGPVLYVQDLKKYENNICKYLKFSPSFYNHEKRNDILKKVMSFIPDANENSIIETHEPSMVGWGELLANRLRCRHLIFLLDEKPQIRNRQEFEYYKFKYDRKELYGITRNVLPAMFADWWQNIPAINGYFMSAYCTNSLVEQPCPQKYIFPKADYTITSIGRIEKDFVIPMVHSVLEFANRHRDKHINFIFIGGAFNREPINKIRKILSHSSNLFFFITGRIFPIPSGLVKQGDVNISSAGSCWISEDCGIPTISVDSNDSKGIGVFQRSTPNSLFRGESEPPIEIEDLLERVLIHRDFVKEDRLKLPSFDFSMHWQVLEQCSLKKNYFKVENIPYRKNILSMIDFCLSMSLGDKGIQKVRIVKQYISRCKKMLMQSGLA